MAPRLTILIRCIQGVVIPCKARKFDASHTKKHIIPRTNDFHANVSLVGFLDPLVHPIGRLQTLSSLRHRKNLLEVDQRLLVAFLHRGRTESGIQPECHFHDNILRLRRMRRLRSRQTMPHMCCRRKNVGFPRFIGEPVKQTSYKLSYHHLRLCPRNREIRPAPVNLQ